MNRPGASKPTSGARKAAVTGFLWLMLLSVVARLTGLVSQIALSRILTTSNFGEIGLASTVSVFVMNIIGFGIDDILVQRQRGLALWSGTALLISFGLACLGAAIIVAISPIAAQVYHLKSMVGLLAFSALSLPIGALSMLPQARIRATMRFKLLSVLSGVEVVITGVLVVLFALWGFGAYSFVIPPPMVAAARALVYWIIAPVRLTRPRLDRVKYLFGRAFSVFGHRIVVSTIGQGDYALLGATTNPTAVGFYYFAFRLAVQPITVLAGNLTGVLFPLLSQHRLQPQRQKEIMLRSLNMVNTVIMPICMLQAALAYPLVPLVFGAKWKPAIDMLVVLTLGISVEAAAWQAGALLNARGAFGKTFKYTVVIAPLFALCIGLGRWMDGALGVAIGVAVYYLIFSGSFTYLALRRDGVTARQVLMIYLKPAALAGAAMGTGFLLGALPPFAGKPVIRAAVTLVVGCGGYVALWRTFQRDSYTMVVEWALGRVLGRFRRAGAAAQAE